MTKNNLNKLVLSTISIILLVSELNAQYDSNDYMKREHSLVKPYQGSGMIVPYWDFYGSTMVTSNLIRLTPDLQSQNGAIWNQIPCMSQNWEMLISFKVHGKGKELFGDGLAFWYARDRMLQGPVFGNNDFFSGMAIILDTYSNHNGPHNHQHPYISSMINNGTLTYDHDRDGTHTQLAGCEAKFRNVEFDTVISVRYENDVLTVSTDIESKGTWKQCFQVQGVQLPTGYFFGVSATTGDLSDNHDIYFLKFYDLDSSPNPQAALARQSIIPQALSYEAPRERTEDVKPTTSNIKIFLYILFGMIGAVVLAIVGLSFYQKHQENSRKRFY